MLNDSLFPIPKITKPLHSIHKNTPFHGQTPLFPPLVHEIGHFRGRIPLFAARQSPGKVPFRFAPLHPSQSLLRHRFAITRILRAPPSDEPRVATPSRGDCRCRSSTKSPHFVDKPRFYPDLSTNTAHFVDKPRFFAHLSTKSGISVDKLTMRRPLSLPPSSKQALFEDGTPFFHFSSSKTPLFEDSTVVGRAGPGTTAGHRVRRLRAISARELWGSQAECSLPARAVAARPGSWLGSESGSGEAYIEGWEARCSAATQSRSSLKPVRAAKGANWAARSAIGIRGCRWGSGRGVSRRSSYLCSKSVMGIRLCGRRSGRCVRGRWRLRRSSFP